MCCVSLPPQTKTIKQDEVNNNNNNNNDDDDDNNNNNDDNDDKDGTALQHLRKS